MRNVRQNLISVRCTVSCYSGQGETRRENPIEVRPPSRFNREYFSNHGRCLRVLTKNTIHFQLCRGEPNTQLDERQVRAIMLVEHYGNFCLMHNEHLEEMNALAKVSR